MYEKENSITYSGVESSEVTQMYISELNLQSIEVHLR